MIHSCILKCFSLGGMVSKSLCSEASFCYLLTSMLLWLCLRCSRVNFPKTLKTLASSYSKIQSCRWGICCWCDFGSLVRTWLALCLPLVTLSALRALGPLPETFLFRLYLLILGKFPMGRLTFLGTFLLPFVHDHIQFNIFMNILLNGYYAYWSIQQFHIISFITFLEVLFVWGYTWLCLGLFMVLCSGITPDCGARNWAICKASKCLTSFSELF